MLQDIKNSHSSSLAFFRLLDWQTSDIDQTKIPFKEIDNLRRHLACNFVWHIDKMDLESDISAQLFTRAV